MTAPQPQPRPKSFPARLALVALAMVLFYSLTIAVLLTAKGLGFQPQRLKAEVSATTVAVFLAFVGTQIAAVLAMHGWVHRRPIAQLKLVPPSVRMVAVGFVFGTLIVLAQTGAEVALASDARVTWAVPDELPLLELFGYFAYWFVIVLTLNSLSEELAYRVYPYEQLDRPPVHPFLIWVLLAVVFSGVHNVLEPFSLRVFVSRMVWAIVFFFAYDATRSLWFIVGIHNGSNCLPMLLGGNFKLGGLFLLEANHAADWVRIVVRVGVASLAVALFVWAFRRAARRSLASKAPST